MSEKLDAECLPIQALPIIYRVTKINTKMIKFSLAMLQNLIS
jgi:hypothetical protein